jgi:HAE1 family hydrophobic/amphiphilic exporter-1
VIGGLVVSTLLSLVFVPAAFSSIDDLERLLGRTLRRVAGLNRPEPPSATA